MHIVQRLFSREALILSAIIWSTYILLEFWIAIPFGQLALFIGGSGFILMLLLGIALKFVLRVKSVFERFVFSAALAVIFAAGQTVAEVTIIYLLGEQFLSDFSSPDNWSLSPLDYETGTAMKLMFKFHIWAFEFFAAFVWLRVTMRAHWQARLRAEQAQIEALRLQLNPHFLFNALSSMEGLMTLKRTDDATRMLHSLSDFYRSTLLDRDDSLILLKDELEVLQDYAAVEQIRFGDRLRLVLDDVPDLDAIFVPPLLLQPLVENAIKHGDDGASPFQVEVAIQLDADQVAIVVRNPMRASPRPPGTGTGLTNVRRRLGLLYGAEAGLEAGPQADAWQARVWLPRTPK